MSIKARSVIFREKIKTITGENSKVSMCFGVSNGLDVLSGGLQLGVANFEKLDPQNESFLILCVAKFPPGNEMYLAFYIKEEAHKFIERLNLMKDSAQGQTEEDTENLEYSNNSQIQYSNRNNNVPMYLSENGKIYLRNKGFWESLDFEKSSLEPAPGIDQIFYTTYARSRHGKNTYAEKEFLRYLSDIVGSDKLINMPDIWGLDSDISPELRRMPAEVELEEIKHSIGVLGGHYESKLIEQYHLALNHLVYKHFVILGGISGTGKTQLAILYSKAVHGILNKNQKDPFFFMCSVRPDWTDPSGLTGYFDVISNKYIVPSFLSAVLTANQNPETPIFVCIDEMNLAKVEYYFADVLSAIESGELLQLHNHINPIQGSNNVDIHSEILIPHNLFIIGTVNIDESTHPFSDKVLDRSSLIDMSDIDIVGYFEFLVNKDSELELVIQQCGELLTKLYNALKKYKMSFGYRTIEEFILYLAFANRHSGSSSNSVIDELICQKILPKLKGTERHSILLSELKGILSDYEKSKNIIEELALELDDFGSFQFMR
ncbi:hypothetical protein A8L34_25870 [Bacillus sp. FJAT-27264]|uniref:McrB family protein n=1 Tax=Paenibacillus sp. (strain DSM 101736 / FJAT-27264) TaxID=1850362 RepID=UPI00080817B6|nr:hypothetical protein [Bacillus sp. FJAT-27264]OBZ07563.1 hypothetical protein A8L34_25870 [Bacillus sp. FJAT-27264]